MESHSEKELQKAGVHTDCSVTDPDRQTGLALMLLHEDGRYVSYVAMGQTAASVRRMSEPPWICASLIW